MTHVKNVNGTVEGEMNRFEKVLSAIEKHQVDSLEEVRFQMGQQMGESVKWKADFEDINVQKLQEVHQAIKMINDQKGKGELDWRDRAEMISQEMKLIENALQA